MIKFNDFKLKNKKSINLSIDRGDFIFFSGDYSSEILESFYFNASEYDDQIFFDSNIKLAFGKDIVFINDDVPMQLNREVLYSFKLAFYLFSTNNRIFKTRLFKLLADSSLINKLNSKVFLLSPKEYRELVYFRALINNPDVVIVDKFFSDIPEKMYLNSLKKLKESGVTILMSGSKFIYEELKKDFKMDLVEL